MTTARKMIPLTDPNDVPKEMSEAEAREFWQTHEVTEAYLREAAEVAELPPVRSRKSHSTSIRLDENITRRLRTLAKRQGKGYQTLLKEFVLERLYEEEKREGII